MADPRLSGGEYRVLVELVRVAFERMSDEQRTKFVESIMDGYCLS